MQEGLDRIGLDDDREQQGDDDQDRELAPERPFLRPRRAAGCGRRRRPCRPVPRPPRCRRSRPARWPRRCCWPRPCHWPRRCYCPRPCHWPRPCCWFPPGPGPAPWRPASRRRCPRLTAGPAQPLPAWCARPGRPLARPPASRHGQRRSSAPLPRPAPLVGIHRHRVELSAKFRPQDRQAPRHRGEADKPATARLDHISARYGVNADDACGAGAPGPRGPRPRPPPGRRPARPGRPRARRRPRRPRAAPPAGRSSGWAGRAVATAAR